MLVYDLIFCQLFSGISEVRNLTIDINTSNLSIEMSWFSPLFRNSSTLIYQIIVINENGVVVLNEITEATSYLLNNITVDLIYNVTIIAIQDGYNSTVTKVIYPNG